MEREHALILVDAGQLGPETAAALVEVLARVERLRIELAPLGVEIKVSLSVRLGDQP